MNLALSEYFVLDLLSISAV